MSETLETVTTKKPELTAEQVAAEELVRRAREQGLSLTGPDGLLKQLTKVVIETALDQELTGHLGHERNTPAGNQTGNVRNGAPTGIPRTRRHSAAHPGTSVKM